MQVSDSDILAKIVDRLGVSPISSQFDEEDRLITLNFSACDIPHLPPEIGNLTNLQQLWLANNRLQTIPAEFGQLTNLRSLILDNNRLQTIPAELGHLTHLHRLFLSGNQLETIPAELGYLTGLYWLYLNDNQLQATPAELGHLTHLHRLFLSGNQLETIPAELGHLAYLQELRLHNNQLRTIPAELGQLTNLQELRLHNNQLQAIPAELGQLTNLQELRLHNNQLRTIPAELGHLISLQQLTVHNNHNLQTLPPEIIAQGTQSMLAYLRELLDSSHVRYEVKLLIVGEGAAGKSSLLKALRNESFIADLSTTHGIEVDRLVLPHPTLEGVEMVLNTWDFGGQQIYHATHQFFLTRRSVYIVVWNARQDVEQGRLRYWLETIQSLAPDAPFLLVATHIDERAPDLHYAALKDEYPQLAGLLGVSNKTGSGISELKAAIAEIAAQLPIMGQPWPKKWLQVEEQLQAGPEHHINVATYTRYCADCGVDEALAKGTLGSYLHDLGKILYFQDDLILSELVILKPNWVTKAISYVLTDERVKVDNGIMQHTELRRIWARDEDENPYLPYLYPVFLRLMERFYLSYQIEADMPGRPSTRSLVPQLLPYQPPLKLPPWPNSPPRGQTQIEMRYTLSFVPAGIMSWFIVRTHLYTQNLHWREGVLLAYQDHQSRVELNPSRQEIRLVVWGQQPYTFFSILMHTIDVILAFFQGLTIRRSIPCNCHWQNERSERCPHFYDYEKLVRRMQDEHFEVECTESYKMVSVPMLLYGIHPSTDPQVIKVIQSGKREVLQELRAMKQSLTESEKQKLAGLEKLDIIIDKLNHQSELICRNFTRQWNYEMKKIEAECPNTFFLLPNKGKSFRPKNWVSQEYRLYLLCQHPPRPHPLEGDDGYSLRQGKEWWMAISPWLNYAVIFLKYAVPLAGGLEKLIDPALIKQFQDHIDLLEKINDAIPHLGAPDSMRPITIQTRIVEEQLSTGAALRSLRHFLKEQDPNEHWGGLEKVLTPDDNILWLCHEHRQQYEAKQAAI